MKAAPMAPHDFFKYTFAFQDVVVFCFVAVFLFSVCGVCLIIILLSFVFVMIISWFVFVASLPGEGGLYL